VTIFVAEAFRDITYNSQHSWKHRTAFGKLSRSKSRDGEGEKE